MPKVGIQIDGRRAEVEEGTTVLEAARTMGIEIPTLCCRDGLVPSTSCMVCAVRVRGRPGFVPSCGTVVEEGMEVESEAQDVKEARRKALELLLGEHAGDCLAPCEMACPARLDVPRMIRNIRMGNRVAARREVMGDIPFPGVLGRICPAPCERACRRRAADDAVSIACLERYAGDSDPGEGGGPAGPGPERRRGNPVAIVGAGPAGLSAAWFLEKRGYECIVYEAEERGGGALRREVGEDRLPRTVLDLEIARIASARIALRSGVRIGTMRSLADVRREHPAVVVAAGEMTPAQCAAQFGIRLEPGPWAGGRVSATSQDGVFAAGGIVKTMRMAAVAVAAGRAAAAAVDQFLRGVPGGKPPGVFSTHLGALTPQELCAAMAGAGPEARTSPAGGKEAGFIPDEAQREAGRCMECDCARREECRLREISVRLGADPRRHHPSRRRMERIDEHPDVRYEPGKCILCGLCIQVAERGGEPIGLTFTGRGFSARVGPPLRRALPDALRTCAADCVRVCPTGALAFRRPRA